MKNLIKKSISKFSIAFCFCLFTFHYSFSQVSPILPFAIGQKVGELINSKEKQFEFKDLSDLEFFSAIIATDSTIEVLYKPLNRTDDLLISDIPSFKTSPGFPEAKQALLNELNRVRPEGTSYSIEFDDDEAPILLIKTSNIEIIRVLRASRYTQHVGFGTFGTNETEIPTKGQEEFENGLINSIEDNTLIKKKIGFGCNTEESKNPQIKIDYPNIYSRPWHYDAMNIQEANKCSAGAGVKIVMLDAGISKDQARLSATGFKKTYSNRSITTTFVSPYTTGYSDCAHGTLMAGVIAGPRYDSAIRGIAYESDFVSMKSHSQVILFTKVEKLIFRDALNVIRKGEKGTNGAKILSMSVGYFGLSTLIEWQLNELRKKGFLMFGAYGTSFDLEINKLIGVFPALSPNVIGVTGVRKGFPEIKKSCDKCHYGPFVDFVVPMQYDDDILTHSLMLDNSNLKSHVGGSSIATATMAGAAAIIWAIPANKSKTPKQIKDILIENASFPNVRHVSYGWGVVNVSKAIGCISDPCEKITCPPGEVCENGFCKDRCDEVVCRPGQYCENGNCFDIEYECITADDCPKDGNNYKCVNGKCVKL